MITGLIINFEVFPIDLQNYLNATLKIQNGILVSIDEDLT